MEFIEFRNFHVAWDGAGAKIPLLVLVLLSLLGGGFGYYHVHPCSTFTY